MNKPDLKLVAAGLPVEDGIRRLQQEMRQFAADRNWEQFHDPKSLAMNLASEVGELCDVYKWMTAEQSYRALETERAEDLRDEMADVFLALLRLADCAGIDLVEAADAKQIKNAARYPAKACKTLADQGLYSKHRYLKKE